MIPDTEKPTAHADHDHSACVSTALADAERYCRQRGLRLTPTRRRVLEIVWRGEIPTVHVPRRDLDRSTKTRKAKGRIEPVQETWIARSDPPRPPS